MSESSTLLDKSGFSTVVKHVSRAYDYIFVEEILFKNLITASNAVAFVIHTTSAILIMLSFTELFVNLKVDQTLFLPSTLKLPNRVNDIAAYQEVEWTKTNVFLLLVISEGISAFSNLMGVLSPYYKVNKGMIFVLQSFDTPENISTKEVIRRWVDLVLTISLIDMTILLCFGEHHFFTVLLVGVISMAGLLPGFFIESEKEFLTHRVLYYCLAALLFIVKQFVIIVKCLETRTHTDEKKFMIAIIYAVLSMFFFSHLLLGDLYEIYRKRFNRDLGFVALMCCTKITVVWMLLSQTRETMHKMNPTKYENGGIDWNELFTVIPCVFLPLLFFYFILLSLTKRRDYHKENATKLAGARFSKIRLKKIIIKDDTEHIPVLGEHYVDERED